MLAKAYAVPFGLISQSKLTTAFLLLALSTPTFPFPSSNFQYPNKFNSLPVKVVCLDTFAWAGVNGLDQKRISCILPITLALPIKIEALVLKSILLDRTSDCNSIPFSNINN